MSYLVKYGTYTPTLTNVTNVTSSTAYDWNYMIVGRIVTVSGKLDIDQDGVGSFEIGASLPWPSDFTAEEQCAGSVASIITGDAPIHVKADTTNNRASINGDNNDKTNHAHYIHFTYIIT